MKKVLIITYYWPPAGGPGVQRWLKLSKYLQEYDAEVHVLSVEPSMATYPLRDESLAGEIGERVTVHYSKTRELFSLYKKTSGRKEVPFSGFANESDKPGPRQKLARFVRGNFFLPDARKAWNRFAVAKASEIIREHTISTIITTSPPHSTQLIGLHLKKKLKVNWIADFRDPWTDIYYYDKMYPTALARSIDRKWERSVLENADTVITVSNDVKRLFLEKSDRLNSEKFKIVPNGFDPADFAGLNKVRNTGKFTILYAGTLTDQYPLEGFLKSLENSELSDKVELKFIGRQDENSMKLLSEYSKKLNIIRGEYIPKSELNQELINSDALLLIIPDIGNNKGILTGKLFDYLGAGKPILCIGPKDGDAAEIIDQASAGHTFSYENFEELNNVLRSWMSNENVASKSAIIQNYSRSKQAKEIANLLS